VKKVFPFSLWLLVLCFFLAACGGDGGGSSSGGGNGGGGSSPTTSNDSPGKIPGLGNTSGNLQGTSFALPSGVTLVGNITDVIVGSSSALSTSKKERSQYSLDPKNILVIGGNYNAEIGSGWIPFKMTLKNSTTAAIKVTFPAGLILTPVDRKAQNAILLKETSVTIPSQQTYVIALMMYCGNMERLNPINSIVFEWGVVSTSTTLKDLIDRLVHKQINAEDFAYAYDLNYSTRCDKLQDIVWNLTDNGVPLSDADKQWIASIPNSNP